jgi:hypothetical protein
MFLGDSRGVTGRKGRKPHQAAVPDRMPQKELWPDSLRTSGVKVTSPSHPGSRQGSTLWDSCSVCPRHQGLVRAGIFLALAGTGLMQVSGGGYHTQKLVQTRSQGI